MTAYAMVGTDGSVPVGGAAVPGPAGHGVRRHVRHHVRHPVAVTRAAGEA
ncbi:hypothetical protein ACLQ2R_26070 [Streptosporangium sp. DT93]